MKVGDLLELCDSRRRNGIWAGKLGLVVDFDKRQNPVVLIEGKIISFHITQIERIINEDR